MKNVKFSGMLRYEDLGFSLHRVTPARDYRPHTHDFHELEIILSGSAINSINGREFPIGPGDVFIVEKGATHEISQIDGLTLYNLGFNGHAMRGIGNDLLKLPGFHALFRMEQPEDPTVRRLKLEPMELERAQALLDEMQEEYARAHPGFQTVLLSGFAQLIVLLSRNYSRSMPERGTWQMAAALAKMERDYAEPLSIAALADSVCLSERHFRRQFEALYQQTPKDYLRRLRLNAAAELLRKKELSVTEIALACGFSDCNYFSRVFRQTVGISPTQYRKRVVSLE
ncbi:MAG: helix-turn-helix domain-containing protein [Ruminococcaceae bacterium]|nr:helix-turn-helix domain-containing protein [Oscillospiraceae bacterium]